MFSTNSIFAATAALSLISSSAATYDASSKSNVALYWGQGANQQDLRVFCDESSVDVIPIAFINVFPDQGNGLIGENFGNKCWGSQPPGNAASYYQGPGNNPSENQLPYQCPTVQDDIPYCQAKGKKILLSLGGASDTYALTGVDEGIALADFLWGAYGPLTPEWTAAGGIRPLDRSSTNTSTSPEYQIDIDGFDFDIEHPSADAQAGYIACIDRLRENFQQNPSKQYIISGAPQCPLQAQNGFEDANMGNMILASQFDIIWIQFYNNGQAGCTARNWADANPNYPAQQSSTTTLNYQQWKNTINSGASNGAKIYLGLLAGPVTDCVTPAGYGDFLNATEADHLISAFQGDDQFGGVMLWEATSALNDCECGIPYFDTIKNSLNDISPPKDCSTVTSSTISTTSSSSSSSTSAPVSTTSSSVTSSSSSSVPASTTSSSSSSSSAPVSTSSSSTSVSSSSSTSTSPTSTPTPTTVPSVGTCVHIGCYSEATNSRALVPGVLVDYTDMSVEKCADYCKDYTMFGVEYGGECYCGNSLQPGSVLEPAGDCNQVCDGTPTEICGAGNRLDIYSCGSSSTSSSASSTQSSSSSVSTTSSASSTVSTTSSASSSSSSVQTTSSSSSVVSTSSTSSSSVETSSSSSVAPTTSSSSSVVVSTTSNSVSSTGSSTSSSVPTLSSSSSAVPVSNTSSSVVPTTSSSSVVVPTSSSSSILTTSSSSSSTFQTLPPYTNSTRTATPTSSSSVETTSSVISISSTGSVEPPTTSSTGSVSPSGTSTDSGVPTSSTVSPSGTSTTSGVSSSTVSPSGTATDSGVPTSSTEVPWTTSTVYTTSVYTITSCAPTVTNCPARIGSVTTEVISLYTTVCPVSQTQGNGGSPAGPTGTPAPPSPPSQPTEVTKYTTSTVYTTKIYTVTSCAPTVTNCPAKLGSVTTEIISLYTTVCPVANQTPGSPGSSPSAPAGPKSSAPGGSVPAVVPSSPAGGQGSGPSGTTTTHVKHTKTTYVTVAFATSTGTIPSVAQSSASSSGVNSGVVSVVPSTMTVIPLPPTTAAPYPTGPSSKNKHHGTGTGTGLPSVSVVYTKQVEVSPVPVSVVKGQQSAVSTPATVPSVKATPVPSQFQGAAGRVGGSFSIVCAVTLGAVALLL